MTSAVNTWFPARFPWEQLKAAMKNKNLNLSNVVVEGSLVWLQKNGLQGKLTDFIASNPNLEILKRIPLPRLDDIFDPYILEKICSIDPDRYEFTYHNIIALSTWIEKNGPRPFQSSAPMQRYGKLHEIRTAKMFADRRRLSERKMKFQDMDSQAEQHKIYYPVNFPWKEWKGALETKKLSHSSASVQGVLMWLEINAPRGDLTDYIGGKEMQSSLKALLPCIDEKVPPQRLLQLASEDLDRYVIVRQNLIWVAQWISRNLPKPRAGSERAYHEMAVMVASDNKQQSGNWALIMCSTCHKTAYSGPISDPANQYLVVDGVSEHISRHGRVMLSSDEESQIAAAQAKHSAGLR